MSAFVLACLQAAVNFARDEQIQTVPALRARLERAGFKDTEITMALRLWGQYTKK